MTTQQYFIARRMLRAKQPKEHILKTVGISSTTLKYIAASTSHRKYIQAVREARAQYPAKAEHPVKRLPKVTGTVSAQKPPIVYARVSMWQIFVGAYLAIVFHGVIELITKIVMELFLGR